MTTLLHVAPAGRRRRRALLGLAAAACALAAAGCSSGTAGAARRSPASCASSRGCTPTTTPAFTVPAGLPSDWSAQAIHTAAAAVQICARATTLQPPDCPQAVVGGQALAVHWTVLIQPIDHAVAVPVSAQPGAANRAIQVAVYGLYQMDVSYMTGGRAPHRYLDYDGGVARAIMTWNGHSFHNVQFVSHDSASSPSPSTVPSFSRPTAVTNAAALAAVRTGFVNCAKTRVPLTAAGLVIPDCPQLFPVTQVGQVTSAHWSLSSNPTHRAHVSFDTAHGNFAVTGDYRMDVRYTTNNGNSLSKDNGPHLGKSSGNYTATLAWDGQHLTLLKIVAS